MYLDYFRLIVMLIDTSKEHTMLDILKNSPMSRFVNWLTDQDTALLKKVFAMVPITIIITLLMTVGSTHPLLTLVVLAGSAFTLYAISKRKQKKEQSQESQVERKEEAPPPKGWYFNNLSWHWKFRPIACFTIGLLAALAAYLVSVLAIFFFDMEISRNPVDWKVLGTIVLVTALYYWFTGAQKDDDGNIFVVPGTLKAALIGWYGMPEILGFLPPIYLTSSTYEWLGKELGFNPILPNPPVFPFTDEAGFFHMGDIPFTVWNDATAEEGTKERGFITAPAKNDATIKATFTMILNIAYPVKLLDAARPDFDLGERARQEFREFTQNFVDTDIPKLHQVLGDVLTGGTLVTCFIGKPVAGRKAGSMIRDDSDTVMFEVVKTTTKDAGQEAVEAAIKKASEELATRIVQRGNPAMREAILKNHPDGTIESRFDTIVLKNPIGEVLNAIGCKLVRTSISDVEYSKAVTDAADLASAEEFQRITVLASGDTTKEYRRKLLPDPDETEGDGFELRTILGAAVDPGNKNSNVRVIWTPSGNPLTSAAVIGASELSKGEK